MSKKRLLWVLLLCFTLNGISACSYPGEHTQIGKVHFEPEKDQTSEIQIDSLEEGYIESGENMAQYDFAKFKNVEITGADMDVLSDEELSVLYVQARYCQAMTDADIEIMREIVSEDMVFTHMSGMQQTREEYFADIADGRLNYFTIGIEDPVVAVNGDSATVTFTSVLNANAYGARGTFRMKGTHRYEKRDDQWIAVNH